MTFDFNNLSQIVEMEIYGQAENEVISRFHTCPPSFLRIFTSGGSTVRVIHTYSHLTDVRHADIGVAQTSVESLAGLGGWACKGWDMK